MPFVIYCLFLSIIHSVLHNLVMQDAKQLLRRKLLHGIRPSMQRALPAVVIASSTKKINDCLCAFMYCVVYSKFSLM